MGVEQKNKPAPAGKLQSSLEAGKFTITAEVMPPRGTDVERFLSKARILSQRVSAINVTDNQAAVMRLSSLAGSALLVKEGMEPVFQLTCRDRNRLALQSDLLGATALGINNVLALSGDHASFGDHKEAKSVFDVDSVQLLDMINSLNNGFNMMGRELKGATTLYPGAVVNPTSTPLEPQLIKFEKKVATGAKFFQTQAVFDVDTFKSFMDFASKFDVKILAGIFLVKSAKNAVFLNNNIPGVKVPQGFIDKMEAGSEPVKTGVEFAARTIQALKGCAHGAHIMAIGNEEMVIEIMDAAGL